jgi:prevent-host-death family protein
MSTQVNIHAAKTNFSKLCEQVEAGEEIVIARAGKPILKLVKIEDEPKPALKSFGFAKDLITGYDEEEFNALDDVIWADWYKKEFDLSGIVEK